MAMDLNAKAAYIRGLMTGMDFDADSKNGKVIAAMMDLLEEMAAQVTEHDNALDQVYDELETLDQDLDDVVSDIYADEDEDDEEDAEDDSTMYEVTCPNCGQISTLDEETLMDPEGDLVCPHCGATFDIELEGTEDDSDRGDRQAGSVIFKVCQKARWISTEPFMLKSGEFQMPEPIKTALSLAAALLFLWSAVWCIRRVFSPEPAPHYTEPSSRSRCWPPLPGRLYPCPSSDFCRHGPYKLSRG